MEPQLGHSAAWGFSANEATFVAVITGDIGMIQFLLMSRLCSSEYCAGKMRYAPGQMQVFSIKCYLLDSKEHC
jgi:hypothetical protein